MNFVIINKRTIRAAYAVFILCTVWAGPFLVAATAPADQSTILPAQRETSPPAGVGCEVFRELTQRDLWTDLQDHYPNYKTRSTKVSHLSEAPRPKNFRPDPTGEKFGSKVFIKTHIKSGTQVEVVQAALRKEAELANAAANAHPGRYLPSYFDDRIGPYGVIVTPWKSAQNLYWAIDQSLTIREQRDVTLQMVDVVAKLETVHAPGHPHVGIQHGDLKLENFLYDGKTLYGIDFGAALPYGPKQLTRMTVGTPNYIAPEALEDFPVGHENDLYSLRIVLWYVLTNRLPPVPGSAKLGDHLYKAPNPYYDPASVDQSGEKKDRLPDFTLPKYSPDRTQTPIYRLLPGLRCPNSTA